MIDSDKELYGKFISKLSDLLSSIEHLEYKSNEDTKALRHLVPNLTVEKSIEISAQLWLKQQKEIASLQQTINELTEKNRSLTQVKKQIAISGVGRSGTTFLIHLLTFLGLDTGYSKEEVIRLINKISKAGLEKDLRGDQTPYIAKDPWLCNYIDYFFNYEKVELEHIIIPMRALDEAAQSRINISRSKTKAPGGLYKTQKPEFQSAVLAKLLYKLLVGASKMQVPLSFLNFPDIIRQPEYLYKKLDYLLNDIEYNTFLATFQEVANPSFSFAKENKEVVPVESQEDGSVFIVDLVRTGGNFLISLLSNLGLNTGIDLNTSNRGVDEETRLQLVDAAKDQFKQPLILKTPIFSKFTNSIVTNNELKIKHVFIPIRAFDEYVNSGSTNLASKFKHFSQPDWNGLSANEQAITLAKALFSVLVRLSRRPIPITFLHFHSTNQDSQYLYTKLQPILEGISYEDFLAVYNSTSNPNFKKN